jgi:hypothetical protein
MESLLSAFAEDKQAILFPAFRQINKALSRFAQVSSHSGAAEDIEVVQSNLLALAGLVKNKGICEALFQFNGMNLRLFFLLFLLFFLLLFFYFLFFNYSRLTCSSPRLDCIATAEPRLLPECTWDQLLQVQDNRTNLLQTAQYVFEAPGLIHSNSHFISLLKFISFLLYMLYLSIRILSLVQIGNSRNQKQA